MHQRMQIPTSSSQDRVIEDYCGIEEDLTKKNAKGVRLSTVPCVPLSVESPGGFWRFVYLNDILL